MKAFVLKAYGGPEQLEIREVAKPVPKDGEVLVKVYTTAVNDWDWCLVRGKPFYIRLLCGLRTPRISIPGAEVAGVIEAVGSSVENFESGDAVYGDISECGLGAFAEYVAVPAKALVKKPASMSFIDAVALPHAALLGLQGLRDYGDITQGQRVLINGAAGGVGILARQIAVQLGASFVAGVDHPTKLELLKRAGFDETIDYTRENFTERAEKYDLILDTKTNQSALNYLKALSPGGRYVTVGGSTPRLIQTLLLGPLTRLLTTKKLKIAALKPNRDLQAINQLYTSGDLRPIIEGPFPFSETIAAVRLFGSGLHKGKIVIDLGIAD